MKLPLGPFLLAMTLHEIQETAGQRLTGHEKGDVLSSPYPLTLNLKKKRNDCL